MEWFVKPEIVRLDLPEGQWIDVKRQLTKGEADKANALLVKDIRPDGRMLPDLEIMGKAEALSYLVDWSLTDPSGARWRIDTDADKLAALNALSLDGFKVISDAIAAHVEQQSAERAGKKPNPGGRTLKAISASAG